jgi:hypothetical protein
LQSADNVIAFIPNSQARETGLIAAKLLKTRDSSGVGSTVSFRTEWSTLSFIPASKDEVQKFATTIPEESNKSSYQPKEKGGYTKLEKPAAKKVVESVSDDGAKSGSASVVIRNLKGKRNVNVAKLA